MHTPSLFASLALVLGIASPAAAQRGATSQKVAGFVVLHFVPTASPESPATCREAAKSSLRGRTLFREYRAADGTPLAIKGQVALRFKASASARQIDSVVAASGVEVFTSANRSACRRYVFAVTNPTADPTAVARELQRSWLVEYATPDFSSSAGSEGIRSDSFFVDQRDLSLAAAGNRIAVSPAPDKYGMGQVLGEYRGPLLRVDGAAMPAEMSSVSPSASAVEHVKSHGITTLRLQVPQRNSPESVRLVVYSLSGTPIRQLVGEPLEAGNYLLGWDGNDDRGRRVQPGVYVVVMTAGSFRETRRLVLR